MRMTVPLTGTVIISGSVWGEGRLEGDQNDFIRPIPMLADVSWTMVDVDLENEVAIIEVKPAQTIYDDSLKKRRPTTEAEKQAFIEHARNHSLERMSKEALYTLSKSPRLKNPFKKDE